MAETVQIDLSSGRQFSVSTVANAAAPTDNVTTPSIVLGPQSATQLKTTGIVFGLKAPAAGAAVPNAGGFSIILWVQNAATGNYFSASAKTVDYRQAFKTYDFDAIPLYFQIDPTSVTTDGAILFEVMEQ